MRIVAAASEPVRLVLGRPLATARGTITVRETFHLRLLADDGAVGVGESAPVYWLGAPAALAAAAADLRTIVARVGSGVAAATLRAWRAEAAGAGSQYAARPGGPRLGPDAAGALDAALLDLSARRRGVPAAAVLGDGDAAAGVRGGTPVATPVPVAALVGGEGAALAAAVRAACRAGFTTLKLKVGAAPLAADVARVAAARAAAGAGVALRLDANRAWTTDEARRALDAFAPFRVAFVEEPLRDGGPPACAALAAASPVAVAVDESLGGAADLERVIAAGARVHVVLKSGRVGGPTALVALARRAAAAGLPVVVTDAIESEVGTGVAVHAAAALASPLAAVGLGGVQLVAALAPLARPWLVAAGPGFAIAPAAAPPVEAARG